tara:strand:+ start:242 stop:1108 length:867 start_codon:yes stop_codon:yes gene_type:complete
MISKCENPIFVDCFIQITNDNNNAIIVSKYNNKFCFVNFKNNTNIVIMPINSMLQYTISSLTTSPNCCDSIISEDITSNIVVLDILYMTHSNCDYLLILCSYELLIYRINGLSINVVRILRLDNGILPICMLLSSNNNSLYILSNKIIGDESVLNVVNLFDDSGNLLCLSEMKLTRWLLSYDIQKLLYIYNDNLLMCGRYNNESVLLCYKELDLFNSNVDLYLNLDLNIDCMILHIDRRVLDLDVVELDYNLGLDLLNESLSILNSVEILNIDLQSTFRLDIIQQISV